MSEKEYLYPKVSVMIITYNQSQFIRETLDSVLIQDYPNLEIVVSDDASTDATSEIIAEYTKLYPNIVPVLNKENKGITKNSNTAFFHCSGEFVAVLGGDDLYFPGKISKQVELMINNPECNLSFHPCNVFNSDSGKVTSVIGRGARIRTVDELISFNFVPALSVMVRRTACPPHGFDERLPVVSDWLFAIETAMGGPILQFSDTCAGYRIHSNNISHKVAFYDDCFRTLQIVREKYPEYEKAVIRGEGILYANEAKRLFRAGDDNARRVALKAITCCLRGGKISKALRVFFYLIRYSLV